jgi:GT2 family glycosyltransferase
MTHIDLEIIILNYNNAEDTINLVGQLDLQETISFHITVVDNCSPDGSFQKLLHLSDLDHVTVVKSNFNGGYAYGNNFGMKLEKNHTAKYVAILNNDISVEDKTLFFKLIEEYKSLERPGFIAPAEKDSDGHIKSHTARKKPSFLTEALNSFLLYAYFFSSQNPYNLDSGKSTMEVDILSGAFLLSDYDYFKEIDYFDEGTFLFLEERILCEKVIRSNKKNYLVRRLGYCHFVSASINKHYSNIAQAELYNDGLLYYFKKYTRYGRFKYLILLPLVRFRIIQLKLLNLARKIVNA